RDVARIAAVLFLGDRVDDAAGERQRRVDHEGIDDGCRRIRNGQHVRRVDRLPAAERRAVEAGAFFEQLFAELTGRNREVLPRAEQIAELEVDRLDLVVLGELENVLWCLCCHASPSSGPGSAARAHRWNQMAALPRSPVRIRMISSMGRTKILPSPMRPVFADFSIVSTTSATCSSRTMISSFTFGR